MKTLRFIFKIVSFMLLLWTIISGAYMALPQEYKDMIPQFNWLTALISGGSTGVLGFSILLIDKMTKKYEDKVDTKYIELAKKFLELNNQYNELEIKYSNIENKIYENTKLQLENKSIIEKTQRLISLDLESKLSNPLVENHIKEKLRGEGVGKEEKEQLQE